MFVLSIVITIKAYLDVLYSAHHQGKVFIY